MIILPFGIIWVVGIVLLMIYAYKPNSPEAILTIAVVILLIFSIALFAMSIVVIAVQCEDVRDIIKERNSLLYRLETEEHNDTLLNEVVSYNEKILDHRKKVNNIWLKPFGNKRIAKLDLIEINY